jgi:hypothetical protein
MKPTAPLLTLAAVLAVVAYQAGAATTRDTTAEARLLKLEAEVQTLRSELGASPETRVANLEGELAKLRSAFTVAGNGDVTITARQLSIEGVKQMTISGTSDVTLKSSKSMTILAAQDIMIKAGNTSKIEAAGNLNLKAASITEN